MNSFTKPPPPLINLNWTATGVYLQRYNDQYYIKMLAPLILGSHSIIQVGDELESCDGKTPVQILDEEILPYESVSTKEAAAYLYTPRIFMRWDQTPGTAISYQFKRNNLRLQLALKCFS